MAKTSPVADEPPAHSVRQLLQFHDDDLIGGDAGQFHNEFGGGTND